MAGLTEELKKGFLTVTEECTRKEERIRNLENRIEILEKAIDRLADTMLIFMDDGK